MKVVFRLQCFIRCFWKKLGFLDENDEIQRDKFGESLNHVNIGRGSDLVDVDQIMDKCSAIKNDDPCDFAYEVSLRKNLLRRKKNQIFNNFTLFQFLKCYFFDDDFHRASQEIEANRQAADSEVKDEL